MGIENKLLEIKVIFKGHVQGVGFRYITEKFANEIGINGTVQNLKDGSVEAVFQATLTQINQIKQKLKDHFGSKLQDIIVISEKDVTVTFSSFKIV